MGNLSGNILIIKDGGDTFEKYVNKTMIDYGIDVLTWQDIVPLNHSFLEKLILSIKSILKLKKQNNLKTYKKVVVFEHTGIIVLLSLLTNIKRKNLILWIWNTKEKKEIKFVNWIYPFCRIFNSKLKNIIGNITLSFSYGRIIQLLQIMVRHFLWEKTRID